MTKIILSDGGNDLVSKFTDPIKSGSTDNIFAPQKTSQKLEGPDILHILHSQKLNYFKASKNKHNSEINWYIINYSNTYFASWFEIEQQITIKSEQWNGLI